MHNLEDKEEELERLKNTFLYQYEEIQTKEQDLRFWKSRLNKLLEITKALKKEIEDEQD